MQHIRSRLGRAVTTRARHTHTAQARLRTRPGTQSASPRVVAGPHLAPVVHTAVQSQLRSFDEPSPRSRLTTIRGHLLQSPCIVPASVLLSVAPHVSALSPNRMQYAPSTHRAVAPDPALLNVAPPSPAPLRSLSRSTGLPIATQSSSRILYASSLSQPPVPHARPIRASPLRPPRPVWLSNTYVPFVRPPLVPSG